MRAPLSWLREYVDLPAEVTGRDLAAKLISAGLEVETVEQQAPTSPARWWSGRCWPSRS